MKLTIYPLEYENNLMERYHCLSRLPGFALLESTDKRLGRYDIVTALPYDEVKIARNELNVHQAFELLEENLPRYSSTHSFPFQGGAIGYISYDLACKFKGISSHPHPLLSNDPLMHMKLYDWAIVTDHKERTVNLITANIRSETMSLVNQLIALWNENGLIQNDFSLKTPFMPLIDPDEYQQSFSSIQEELIKGRAYQVNYTFPFMAEYEGDTWTFYKRISRYNPVPYSAFLRHEDMDVLSFSPERFILSDQEKMLTSPIKGSAPRSDSLITDQRLKNELAASVKNRAENIMIVDLMRNDLGRIAKPGSVKVQRLCQVQSFNSVHHLVSDIVAERNETISMIEAFKMCFPGGSITGAPKLEAMKIIAEQERFSRGIYCGSIGYFSSHGRFDTNISIRTVTAKSNSLYLPAGGGIIMDSRCEGEFDECYTKIRAITKSA